MLSSDRPYLIDALHRWIIDNECTPFLLVDANFPGAKVPKEYVQDGEIVLNIKPSAVRDFSFDHEAIRFQAAFPGVAYHVVVPIFAIRAIYAKENGEGMFFDPVDPKNVPAVAAAKEGAAVKKAPHLRVIK